MTKEDFREIKAAYSFAELVEIIALLRGEGGCPWDREQTFESMKKCLSDECAEVLEAVDKQDDDNLCEELGDVLLQVLLYSQIAKEKGLFSIDDVMTMLGKKMIRRHPHVFGDLIVSNPQEALASWKAVKAAEKAARLTDR